MKKQLILFISAMLCLASFAYDYQTFYSHRTCYYENGTGIIAAMKIDSVKFDGDSILYPMKQLRMKEDYCYDTDGAPWMGHTIIVTPSWNYFLNKNNDSIRIKTDAKLDESWEMFNDGMTTIRATVISISRENLLNTTDSVKTIRLEVWDPTMQPRPHFLHWRTLKLSKNSGLTYAFNLFDIPRINGGNFEEFKLAGITNPCFGIQDFNNLEVFDFQPGDEFHIVTERVVTTAGVPAESTRILIRKILTRNDSVDLVWYDTYDINEYYRGTVLSLKSEINNVIIARSSPLFDQMPGKTYFWVHYLGTSKYLSTNYIRKDGFLRKGSTVIPFSESLNCYSYFTDEISDVCNTFVGEYYKGLGGPYFTHTSGCWEIDKEIETSKLQYYKKGETSWGTPHVINSLTPQSQTTPRIHIFPNPAIDHINVKGFSTQGNLTFKIINLQGISVHNGAINENNATIQVSSLAGGLYFISIFSDDVCIGSGRFMKQ